MIVRILSKISLVLTNLTSLSTSSFRTENKSSKNSTLMRWANLKRIQQKSVRY